jgi:hypothetical protein
MVMAAHARGMVHRHHRPPEHSAAARTATPSIRAPARRDRRGATPPTG